MLDLFYRSYWPLLKFCFRTFLCSLLRYSIKCFIWIAFDFIQINFEFRHAWPTFTGFNALCKNLVLRTFPKLFSVVFWFIDLKITFGFLSVFVGVMPLETLLGPVGDMYCLSNAFRMLVISWFLDTNIFMPYVNSFIARGTPPKNVRALEVSATTVVLGWDEPEKPNSIIKVCSSLFLYINVHLPSYTQK